MEQADADGSEKKGISFRTNNLLNHAGHHSPAVYMMP
jgi:hypothetical protein